MEATCAECGSVYRGKALSGLDVDRWERRGEVLHELRWCICQRGRKGRDVVKGAVVIAHPELGANVALVDRGYDGTTPETFARATATTYVTSDGRKFRRGSSSFKDGALVGASGYRVTRVQADELPRLEAWAASQTKETTR